MEYGEIIKRSWSVTWRNKALWIFGIAAALFGGGMKGSGGGPRGLQYAMGGPDIDRWRTPWLPGAPSVPMFDWRGMVAAVMGVLFIFLVIGIVLAIVSIIVRYTSHGALIGMVNEVEETGKTTFKSGLSMGWKRLLHLLGINVIIGIGTFVAMLLVMLIVGLIGALGLGPGIALVASERGLVAPGVILIVVTALVLLLLIVLISLAVSAAVTLLRVYAFRSSVIDQESIFDALSAAFKLAKGNPRESILMWLLMLAIQIAVGIVMVPIALLGAGFMIGPALGVYALTDAVWPAVVAALPGTLAVLVVSALVGGVYACFQSAVWTLTYRELNQAEPVAE